MNFTIKGVKFFQLNIKLILFIIIDLSFTGMKSVGVENGRILTGSANNTTTSKIYVDALESLFYSYRICDRFNLLHRSNNFCRFTILNKLVIYLIEPFLCSRKVLYRLDCYVKWKWHDLEWWQGFKYVSHLLCKISLANSQYSATERHKNIWPIFNFSRSFYPIVFNIST